MYSVLSTLWALALSRQVVTNQGHACSINTRSINQSLEGFLKEAFPLHLGAI